MRSSSKLGLLVWPLGTETGSSGKIQAEQGKLIEGKSRVRRSEGARWEHKQGGSLTADEVEGCQSEELNMAIGEPAGEAGIQWKMGHSNSGLAKMLVR